MPKSEVEEVTEKAISEGGILAKLYFDMTSKTESELQPIMADLINNRLLKAPGVLYCYGAIEEPMKVKDDYTTSATVTVLFKDLGAIINVVFNFAPAGIEIIKPLGSFAIKTNELQSIILSLSQISADYSQYILSRVLKKEDLDKVMQDLKNREKLGRKLLKKDDESKS